MEKKYQDSAAKKLIQQKMKRDKPADRGEGIEKLPPCTSVGENGQEKRNFMKPEIKQKFEEATLRLLRLHYEAHAGHIGGNLSCLDILLVLFHLILTNSDLFLLSKGHSAGALYTVLWSIGKMSEEELRTFTQDNTRLGVHPPMNLIPEVVFGTGRLGHGLSLCTGMALAEKMKGGKGRIFCQSSDGEMQEGSVWEALGFAAHHRLSNLRLLVDVNGWQGFGETSEVFGTDLKTLGRRIEAFGWEVRYVENGHDQDAIEASLAAEPTKIETPLAILYKTRKGHRVPCFENQLKSHYLPLSTEQYEEAVKEVKEAYHA